MHDTPRKPIFQNESAKRILTIITVFHKINQFISVSELFIAKIKAPINGLPQDFCYRPTIRLKQEIFL